MTKNPFAATAILLPLILRPLAFAAQRSGPILPGAPLPGISVKAGEIQAPELGVPESAAASLPTVIVSPELASPAAAPESAAAGSPAAAPAAGPSIAASRPDWDFDAVVIGSGYGGSVMAHGLAREGLAVAVLEQGRRFLMGQMPRDEQSYWEPDHQRYGPHWFRDLGNQRAWTGSALGGGSIVNAAIMLRKKVFKGWPGGIDARTLDAHYRAVESMLDVQPFPVDDPRSPYYNNPKTRHILEAAQKLGRPALLPNMAITLRKPGEPEGLVRLNRFGAPQQGCVNCGECSLPGCNYGAKNTLDLNYLRQAEAQYGAKVLTSRSVERAERLPGGGWLVHAKDPATGAESAYRARLLVGAGGTIATSEFLLRQKHVLRTMPGLSDRLGERYATNGNFIGFGIGAKRDIHPARGPEITAGVEFPGEDGEGQGFYIFDGSYRNPWMILGRLIGLPTLVVQAIDAQMNMMQTLGLFQPEGTLPLLVLGRDSMTGRLSLDEDGRIKADMELAHNEDYYDKVEAALKAVTHSMDAHFLPFPLYHMARKIEVPHPLGGAVMAEDFSQGVVDHLGRAFGEDDLVIMDGSVIPVSLGANPALTIGALADRSAPKVAAQLKSEGRVKARP